MVGSEKTLLSFTISEAVDAIFP